MGEEKCETVFQSVDFVYEAKNIYREI
jgi:hypothetical protein